MKSARETIDEQQSPESRPCEEPQKCLAGFEDDAIDHRLVNEASEISVGELTNLASDLAAADSAFPME